MEIKIEVKLSSDEMHEVIGSESNLLHIIRDEVYMITDMEHFYVDENTPEHFLVTMQSIEDEL